MSRLVRNFVPEKSRKSIMLRQTESPFEVLLNRHSYSSAQSARRLNTLIYCFAMSVDAHTETDKSATLLSVSFGALHFV